MEENRNKDRNADQQSSQLPIDKTTDESGLHLQNPPKGADQMNASFGKPDPDDLQQQAANLQKDTDRDIETEKGHSWREIN